MTYMLHSIQSPQPLECRTLQEAMARAGHPDPADWLPYTGMPGWPDRIATESMVGEPAIEAVNVAHELIRLLPVAACASRLWSDADPAITGAVWNALPSPFVVSAGVAARLCAHYAVAGVLSWATIADTVAAVFRDAVAGHASDIGPIITGVIAALAAKGIPTLPPPASATRALRAAPWRPGIAWLASDGAPAACVRVRSLDLKAASRAVRGGRAPSSPVTPWFDAAPDRILTALDKASAPLIAFDTWARRIMSPVWTITIPGGKLPSRWCTRLSRLLSGVLPMAVCCAGIFGVWHAARSTAVWGGAWQGAWPGITLWVITWWLVSLIPEKLLGLRLRPVTTPHRGRRRLAAARLLVVPDETTLILGLLGGEPLGDALLRLALQSRRTELSAGPPAPPGDLRQLPPAGRQAPADGQQ